MRGVDPAVLALYAGAERLQVEQALDDERLARRARLFHRRPRRAAVPVLAVVPAPRRPCER